MVFYILIMVRTGYNMFSSPLDQVACIFSSPPDQVGHRLADRLHRRLQVRHRVPILALLVQDDQLANLVQHFIAIISSKSMSTTTKTTISCPPRAG